MSALLSYDRKLLDQHPLALQRAYGASLPYPLFDPNPRLTIALHELWRDLRPFLSIENNAPVFLEAIATRSEAFAVFGPALVSSFSISSMPFFLIFTFFCTAAL